MIIKTKANVGFEEFHHLLALVKLKRTCSVKGCTCDAEAIILYADPAIPKFTLCKAHYEHGLIDNKGWDYKLNLSSCITKNVKIGDKVHYIPDEGEPENGMIKEIGKKGKFAFVVYKCGDDWKNYIRYTGVRTDIKTLFHGWVENTKEGE